ncbi:MAG: class I tRNA ligase family protein, partial [Candidatus Levyibacteriota bacterium]
EDFFPPDFIAEYTGQIRAWFYVLHVIGAALYDSPAYKNVVVEGVILGTDGRKMSKNYGNYPDPKELLQKYGGDALRLYLLSSPVMHGEDIIISEEAYRQQVKGTMLILWNSYNFFITYANVDAWDKDKKIKSENVLDKWILSLLNKLVKEVSEDLDNYDTVATISKLQKFVDDFSTWYIRRSRDRVGPTAEDQKDKNKFYTTCHEVLTTLSKLLAPVVPFVSEEMFRNLTEEDSVHLASWPETNEDKIDDDLERKMDKVREIVEKGHAKRKIAEIKLRQPLRELMYVDQIRLPIEFENLIKYELNILNVSYGNPTTQAHKDLGLQVTLATEITPKLKSAGEARDIVRKIQEERKKIGTKLDEKVDVQIEDWPKEFESEIKRKALVSSISKGEFKVNPSK